MRILFGLFFFVLGAVCIYYGIKVEAYIVGIGLIIVGFFILKKKKKSASYPNSSSSSNSTQSASNYNTEVLLTLKNTTKYRLKIRINGGKYSNEIFYMESGERLHNVPCLIDSILECQYPDNNNWIPLPRTIKTNDTYREI